MDGPASALGAYDPALAEAARDGDLDEELAVIVRLTDGDALPEGVRVVTRFGDVATLRVRRARVAELAECSAVVAVEASRRLRLNDTAEDQRASAALMDVEAPDAYARRPPEVAATGRGVVIGVLDWGLDVAHPAFRHPDGTTRLLALWDQRGAGRAGPDNRWGYGRILTAEQIDEALRSADPYRALDYHPGDADEHDRDSGAWKGAHGTHVCDIAAGNGSGGGLAGVAPGADLIFVHLSRTTRVLGPGNLGDSVTVLEALDFVFSVAGDRPCVVNMSVGAHGGPHDGTTLVEQGIDEAVWLRNGRAVVNSAGNYFAARAHAQGRVGSGAEQELRFDVPADDPTDSELEIYYESVDRFTAVVAGPSGAVAARAAPGEDSPLTVDGAVVGHVYHHVRDVTSNDRHVDLFLRPAAPAGVWEIRLAGDVVQDGRYHAWIERDRGLRPRFVAANIAENSTTGTLCNGRFSITVGAYDPHRGDRSMGAFSSAGPTRDGRVKPEIVAPGVAIRAARSTPPADSPDARYTTKSGTSMAAPHVAGTVALMFEAAGRPLEVADTRALLFASADCAPLGRDGLPARDLHRLGYGYLDTAAAERAAREWGRAGAASERDEAVPDEARPAGAPASSGGDMAIRIDENPERLALLEAGSDNDAVQALAAPADDGHVVAGPLEEMSAWPGEHTEQVTIDDVTEEMRGLRCTFVRDVAARRADGTTRTFAASAIQEIADWNGTAVEALIAGFPVLKVALAPRCERIAAVRRYDVGLDAQRAAVARNARELRDWIAREAAYRGNRSLWQREKRRLEDLLARRQVTYSRLWVRQMMYNRFDRAIAQWTQRYNGALRPDTDLDPNIVKSLVYQESRMGTSGAHLMPPPSDWTRGDRHPIRSRFNIGQAIDSWGPQQWLMLREMAPAIFAAHGLDAFAGRARWRGMSNDDYAAHRPFMRALREFFERRDAGRNLMGTPDRDLHEDYGFWIRTAIRWLFLKYGSLSPRSWSEAVRAYNGGGPRARRYRDAVMARVGGLDPFIEDLRDPGSAPEELFAPVAQPALGASWPRTDAVREPETPPSEARPPRLDRSAELEWEDLHRIPDSRGGQQVFYLITGAPPGQAPVGFEGWARFPLRVRNTNSVFNHQDVVTRTRLLDILSGRQFREVMPWTTRRRPELADESSHVLPVDIRPEILAAAYNSDSPLTRLEVEYHWREAGERSQRHYNRVGLDFALVAPIEFLLSRRRRLHPDDIELKDPAQHKNDYWIPILPLVNFTPDIRDPFTFQLEVSTSVTRSAALTRTTTVGQSRSDTRTRTVSDTFSMGVSGELSRGGSASASIEILELGLQQMFKLGASLGYSRTRTDTSSTTVAREFSQSLSISQSYSATQAATRRITITVSPPDTPGPMGTGSRSGGARATSVGVYLYPVVAFFEVPYVRFDGVNSYGQATRRTSGTVAVPFVTMWGITTQRGT